MEIIQSNTTITSSLPATWPAYVPICCDFHDELEILAMSRKYAILRYLDEVTQAHMELVASIVNVFSQQGVEYIRLSNHAIIRLDLIVSINNKRLANYCES